MPIAAAIPAIIGAGGAIGGALIGKKASDNANKTASQIASTQTPLEKQQQDLIAHQTEVGKWGFAQAQGLLPQAKGAIDLPFEHFKAILSGDPNEFNKVLSGSNQAVDQQTQQTRRNISAFAPRGAIAGQLGQLAQGNAAAKQSNYFQAYINALSGAQGSATQYSNLFNSVLSSGQNAGVPALNALTSMQGFQTQQDIASAQLKAQALQGLGTGLGQIITALILNRGSNSRGSTLPKTGGGTSPDVWSTQGKG